jgi:N-acetylglucosaminyldiphosphoundecaprenol N-acetyl-beta-D-mannosaminyltransferase
MASFAEDSALEDMTPPQVRPRRGGTIGVPSRGPECSCQARRGRPIFVNSVRFDPVSPIELAERVAAFLNCGESHVVHFCAAHPTVLARGDETYRDLLNRGDLNVPDGMAVAWALRLFGCPAERLAGSDAMSFLCQWGVEHKSRHYLFGGTPAVVARLKATLEASFPGIHVVGAESPPFRPLSDEEWADAAKRIKGAGADLVWVGLGTPKQDWAADRLRELDSAPAIMCVGAAFDFLSGAKRRAPRWMQGLGLEWAHRLASDPRRLSRRYVVGNFAFLGGVVRDYRRAPRLSSGE